MNRYLKIALTSAVLTTSLNAYDNYIKTSLLYSTPNDFTVTNNVGAKSTLEMDYGYAAEIAYGVNLSSDFAVELQYAYDKANTNNNTNSNIKAHSVYVNGVYNIKLDSPSMHPYIGLGVGASDFGDGTNSTSVFTYQGFLGVSFDTDYNVETFAEYKYKSFEDVEFDSVTYDDTAMHQLGVGVKSRF